jgi:hypothetical protein
MSGYSLLCRSCSPPKYRAPEPLESRNYATGFYGLINKPAANDQNSQAEDGRGGMEVALYGSLASTSRPSNRSKRPCLSPKLLPVKPLSAQLCRRLALISTQRDGLSEQSRTLIQLSSRMSLADSRVISGFPLRAYVTDFGVNSMQQAAGNPAR